MSAHTEEHESAGLRGFVLPAVIGLALAGLAGLLSTQVDGDPAIGGIPTAYFLFIATLGGIAVFHRLALEIALSGALSIAAFLTWQQPGFSFAGTVHHEWVILVNLFGLLVGFGLLAAHFEHSGVPERLPRFLPSGWKGAFVLLVIVWVMSGFLDNIAAAMIGGGVAFTVFKGRVHIGYLAGLVACANAGGAGSVLGDTTTTMMWIGGVSPLTVLPAYLGAFVALFVAGIPASILQDSYQSLEISKDEAAPVDRGRVMVVAFILLAAVTANVLQNTVWAGIEEHVPVLAIAIWIALLGLARFRRPDWAVVPSISRGSLFLIALVMCASMMPLSKLPVPTPVSAFAIGGISSVFDNIPLTALALRQGGYDWALMAFAVGFGGSIVWFGSSAGVALSARFPAARSTAQWLRYGWPIPIAYAVSYTVMWAMLGWHPEDVESKHGPHHEEHEQHEDPAHPQRVANAAAALLVQPGDELVYEE